MAGLRTFCGGLAQTNGYVLDTPGGSVLIDAPEGVCDWLASNDLSPVALLLTHMHFDHVMDVAAVADRFACPVFAHSDISPELHLGRLFGQFTGVEIEMPPVMLEERLEGRERLALAGGEFSLLHVPGHSPDSVCYYREGEGILFGGDTLFRAGIGRTDLPGGDEGLLLRGIREKLFGLPGATRVYPGHGEATTIESERTGNPFL